MGAGQVDDLFLEQLEVLGRNAGGGESVARLRHPRGLPVFDADPFDAPAQPTNPADPAALDWHPVESTNLAAVAHDPITPALYVRFTHGGSYRYAGVDAALFDRLLNAPSKGSFFHKEVRNGGKDDRFPCEKLPG